jgi:hypothetical protein
MMSELGLLSFYLGSGITLCQVHYAKHIIEMAAAVLRTPPWRSGSS